MLREIIRNPLSYLALKLRRDEENELLSLFYIWRERERVKDLPRVPQDPADGHCHSDIPHRAPPTLRFNSHRAIIRKQGQLVISRVLEGISLFQLFNAWMLSHPAQFCLISCNEIFIGILMSCRFHLLLCVGKGNPWNKQNLHNENSMDTSIKQILKTSLLGGTAHSLPLKWSRDFALLTSFQRKPKPHPHLHLPAPPTSCEDSWSIGLLQEAPRELPHAAFSITRTRQLLNLKCHDLVQSEQDSG